LKQNYDHTKWQQSLKSTQKIGSYEIKKIKLKNLDICIFIWEFINIINEQNKWRNYLSCKLQNPFILLSYIIRKNLLCYLIQKSNARHIAKHLLSMKKFTPNYWMLGSLWDSYALLQLSNFSNSLKKKLLQHSLFLESKLKKVESKLKKVESSMGPLFIAINQIPPCLASEMQEQK
jgi:hypothetical protein